MAVTCFLCFEIRSVRCSDGQLWLAPDRVCVLVVSSFLHFFLLSFTLLLVLECLFGMCVCVCVCVRFALFCRCNAIQWPETDQARKPSTPRGGLVMVLAFLTGRRLR